MRLLILGGIVALQRGDSPHAESRLEAALAQARQLGDGSSEAQALIVLGGCKLEAGKLEEAASLCEESAVAYDRIGDPSGFSNAIAMLGEIAFQRGEYGEAVSRFEEALSLKRQTQDAEIAYVLVGLARLALVREDVEEAMLHAREALRTASRTGIGPHLAAALNIVARSVAAANDPERATRLFSASETLSKEVGGVVLRAGNAERARTIAAVRETLGDARFDELCRLGAAMSAEDAAEYALAEN